MAGYTRQSSAEIADTLTIEAVDLNNEFDKLVAVFNNGPGVGGGHKHDGTAAEGPVIELIGDAGLTTPLNKILVDTTNKHIEFYTDVSSAAVQQLRIQDGAIVPILDNDIDIGTTALEFKDGFFDGTVNLDTLVIGTSTGVTSVDTDLTSASASDDTLASAKAIKTYVDAVPVGDLTAIVAGDGLTGTSLSGPIPTLNVIGGNGITANADELVIDTAITVDKTTAQILSAKTLTSPVLNTGISGTAFLDEDDFASDSATKLASQQSVKAYVDGKSHLSLIDEDNMATDSATRPPSQQSVKAYVDGQAHSSVTASSTTTFTGKTIDANGTGNSITNLEVADLASGVLDTDITSVSGSDDTLASAKAIKTYVDAQAHLSLIDEDSFATDSATRPPSQQSVKAYVDGQTHLSLIDEDNFATDSATRPPSQQSVKAYADTKLANVSEDSTPTLGGDLVLNGNNIDFPTTANISDCLDEDNMASDSATKLATQQSIKAYVDSASGKTELYGFKKTNGTGNQLEDLIMTYTNGNDTISVSNADATQTDLYDESIIASQGLAFAVVNGQLQVTV